MDDSVCGWLLKLGGGKSEGRKWQRRYFVLQGDLLVYYASQRRGPADGGSPSGVACVRGCNVQARAPSAGAGGSLRFEFAIHSPDTGDTLVLASASDADTQMWCDAITLHLEAQPEQQSPRGHSRAEADSGDPQGSEVAARDGVARETAVLTSAVAALETELADARAALARTQGGAASAEADQAAARAEHEDAAEFRERSEERLSKARE